MEAHLETEEIGSYIKYNAILRKYFIYLSLLIIAIFFTSCSESATTEAPAVTEEAAPVTEAAAPVAEEEASVAEEATKARAIPMPSPIIATIPTDAEKIVSSSSKNLQINTNVIQNKSTPNSESPIQELASKLHLGHIAWNTPPTMTVGESADVELRVTLDPEMFEGLAKRITSAGTTTTESVELSDDLTATLSSVNSVIEISPNEPRRQNVFKGRDAQWNWVIHPVSDGNHTLNLSIVSHINNKVTGETFTRKIFVNALPPPTLWEKIINFLRADWEKFLTLVLIPIGGWLYSIYIKRRKSRR